MPTTKTIPVRCPKCGLADRELPKGPTAPNDQALIDRWYVGPTYDKINDKLVWHCHSCKYAFTTFPEDAERYD